MTETTTAKGYVYNPKEPEPPKIKAPEPSILDMLVDALAIRIKDKIMEEIDQRIAESQRTFETEGLDSYIINSIEEYNRNLKIDAENVFGLDRFVGNLIEENERDSSRTVDADDVNGLEEYIKDMMKEAIINIDFV